MNAPASPFLEGNFAPIREERDLPDLRVDGELPPELDGVFVRNGPDPQFDPRGAYHWFDGDGMLHATALRGGRAHYRNRWVRTQGFETERAAGRALWGGLFEPPDFENPHGPFKNTANTALVHHAGRLLALWEAGPPHEIALPSLDTRGLQTWGGRLPGPFTAHPKVDARTGEMVFFGYQPFPPYCTYGVLSAGGELLRLEPIELPGPVMMHDMAITANFSLLLDLPLVFDFEAAARGDAALRFDPERPSRWGLLPRHGGNDDVRWFETPPCYVFHTANAYEEGDAVVLHGCRMETTDVLQDAGPEEDANNARMHRWRFDLASGDVKEEPLDERAADFPRIRDELLGHPHRFSYTARFAREARGAAPRFEGLSKHDHRTGAVVHHDHGPGRFGGEAVFAPRPGAAEEDDGWLLTYVRDEREGRDELVVIDAREPARPPVARVHIPGRIPYGFHAAWVPSP